VTNRAGDCELDARGAPNVRPHSDRIDETSTVRPMQFAIIAMLAAMASGTNGNRAEEERRDQRIAGWDMNLYLQALV